MPGLTSLMATCLILIVGPLGQPDRAHAAAAELANQHIRSQALSGLRGAGGKRRPGLVDGFRDPALGAFVLSEQRVDFFE